jgi:hypothetical protein
MSDFLGILGAMFIAWLLTFIFLEPPIFPLTIAHAEKVCEQNGGWKMIEEGYNIDATVYCKNGAEFDYDASEIRKEKSE